MRSSLERLLGDCSKHEFLRDTFERHPRVFPQALSAADIDALFSIDHLDHLFANFDLRYPYIELIDGGHADKPPITGHGVVDRIHFLEKVRGGASMRLRDLQMLSPSVMKFIRRLSQELSGFTSVNAYITPPGEQGFDAHFDRHDVFIVQCFGDKHWVLNETYERQMELPNERVLGYDPKRPSNPDTEQQILLRQGDVLYMPRGVLHYATASERGSVHITLACRPVTWGQVLQLAIAHAERTDPEFRKTASTCLYQDLVERQDTFAATIRALLSRIDGAPGVAAARKSLASACPAPADRILSEIFRSVRIGADTRVALSEDGYFRLERDEEGHVASIATNGTRMSLEGREQEYLARLEGPDGITAMEMTGSAEEREACVQFIETLFRHGIVSVVDAAVV